MQFRELIWTCQPHVYKTRPALAILQTVLNLYDTCVTHTASSQLDCWCGGAKAVRESPGLRRGKKQGDHHPRPQPGWPYFCWAPRWVPGCDCNTCSHIRIRGSCSWVASFCLMRVFVSNRCPLSYNWLNHFYNLKVSPSHMEKPWTFERSNVNCLPLERHSSSEGWCQTHSKH